MNTRSNGSVPSAISRSSVSTAGPTSDLGRHVTQARPHQGVRGDRGVRRGDLERRERAVGGQRAGQPDGAVPAERPDLQDPPSPERPARSGAGACPGSARRRCPGSPAATALARVSTSATSSGTSDAEVVVDRRPQVRPRRRAGARRPWPASRRRGDVDEPEGPFGAQGARGGCHGDRRATERRGDRVGLLRTGGDDPDLARARGWRRTSATPAAAEAWGSRARRPSTRTGRRAPRARGTGTRRARRDPCRAAGRRTRGCRPRPAPRRRAPPTPPAWAPRR